MNVARSDHDAIVIGAGFGGLGCALRLAEMGARVVLLEALNYPGGCASTFQRDGYRFEAGATLASGLGPGQLFSRWNERYDLGLSFRWLDPVVEHRFGDHTFRVPPERRRFIDAMVAAAPAGERVRGFFDRQRSVADTLWRLFDDERLLPPFDLRAFGAHVISTPSYASLLPLLGLPLGRLLRRMGLADDPVLRPYLESVCQITVQCAVDEAESAFALAAMDYYFRGTGHVQGGFGALASGLVTAIGRAGGAVHFASRARAVERDGDGWRVSTRRGEFRAPVVVANMLPQALERLVGAPPGADTRLRRLSTGVTDGWGAAMLYRVVRAPASASSGAHHLDLTPNPEEPLTEGRHVFVSISAGDERDRAPEGMRTVTVSTHIPASRVASPDAEDAAAYYARVHERMRETIATMAPEWADVVHELPGSPRTFERFTRRTDGWVGGIPRRAGLHHYRELWPRPVRDGLWLVGDSVFPGQSALATAIGGVKTAERVGALTPASPR